MSAMARPSIGGRALTKTARPADMYSFPLLPPEVIKSSLEELRITGFDVDDISKGRQEAFRQICEIYLMDILRVSREHIYGAEEAFIDTLNGNEELHDESIPVLHFLHYMNKLLDAAHCERLTLRDLMRPPPQRTTRVLSALINLQKFKADRLDWYVDLENRKMTLLQQKEGILSAHEEVKERIAAVRALRESEQPEIDALTASNAVLAAEVDRLRLAESTARASASKTRDEIAALKTHIEETVAATAATKADTDMKRSQIVSSPLRVKAEVGVLEAAVATEQAVVAQLHADKQTVSRQVEVVAKADKDVTKAMTLMSEAEAEAVKLKRIIKDSKAKSETRAAIAAEAAALEEELSHQTEKRKRAEERLQEVREVLAQKLSAQHRQLEATRREIAEYEEEIRAATETRQAAEREKESLERQKEVLISRHAAEVADMVASMKRFSSAVGGYHTSLLSSLSTVAAIDLTAPHSSSSSSATGSSGVAATPSTAASSGVSSLGPGGVPLSAMKPFAIAIPPAFPTAAPAMATRSAATAVKSMAPPATPATPSIPSMTGSGL